MRAKHERKLQSLCGMGQVRFSAPENEVDAEEVAFVSLATQRSPPTRPLSSEFEELSASTENVQSSQVVRSSQVSQTTRAIISGGLRANTSST